MACLVDKNVIILIIVLVTCSCSFNTKEQDNMLELKEHTGWWIYGEGQHIFKDENTLAEWELTFPNENMDELVELYLAVCEMEYFPMECTMRGSLINDTLQVADFNITYIQGCGE